jgi:hypothetical protein
MSETLTPYTVLQIQKDRDAMLLQSAQPIAIEHKPCLRRYLPHVITIICIIGLIIVLFLLIHKAYN